MNWSLCHDEVAVSIAGYISITIQCLYESQFNTGVCAQSIIVIAVHYYYTTSTSSGMVSMSK